MNVVRTFEEAVTAYQPETIIALDLETSGFSPYRDRPHVITMYGSESDTIAVLHYPTGVKIPQRVLDWIASFPEIVTHNGTMFDILFLAALGMEWDKPDLYDTMVGELAVMEVGRKDQRVNLQDTIKRRMGKVIDKEIDHAGWGNAELNESQLDYVTGDIRYLLGLRGVQIDRAIERGTHNCVKFEMLLTKPVIRMELHGLPIDVAAINAYFESHIDRFMKTTEFLTEMFGPINFGSHVQVKAALNQRFPRMFRDTKAETLQARVVLGGEMGAACQAMLDWRNFKQRRNMFSEEWQREHVHYHSDGSTWVHGKFWQIGTNTGRFSATDPNLQQVPVDMRHCYGGAEGWAVGHTDYSQIEVRVAAALAEDHDMVAAFNAGEDIHRVVASAAFGKPPGQITTHERSVAKAMSFTLVFGGGIKTFRAYAAQNGSIISEDDAVVAVHNFFERFPALLQMREAAEAQATFGAPKVLTYPTGLKRLVQGYDLKSSVLLNNIVQGTASAGLKKAMLYMEEHGVSQYLSAIVHDEAVYTAPYDIIEDVRDTIDACMIDGMKWALTGCPPVSIGVESTWGRTWVGDDKNERKIESGI